MPLLGRKKNRNTYQVIDDDFDDTDVNIASTTSLLGSEDRSRLHYLDPNAEQRPLVEPTTSTDVEVGYQGPPNSHHAASNNNSTRLHNTPLPHSAPPLMGSSSSQEHRWEHIENLDQFFTRVYEYHQGGGYLCIAAKHVFSLAQFVFIVIFSTFFLQCIDYDVLFRNTNSTASGEFIPPGTKRHFGDAIVDSCAQHLHPFIIIAIAMAVIFWASRVIKTGYYLLQLREIQEFYTHALSIEDNQLSNLTWHSIVTRICEVQPRLHIIVNFETISPIDLYHRILRFKNYFVALVNQRVLPPVLKVPFYGEVPYLPNGLKANLEWLLFWGYFSPWRGPYVLKEEYRNMENLEYLTMEMERTVTYLGLFNLIFFPLIFLYQLLYSFFTLAEMIKREPGSLGTRRYSNYGRYRLRHFNELEHELKARLNRSHAYATAYVNQFYSPLGEILAKNVAFVAGAIFGVLAVLTAWDEDVLQVEHVLTVMTVAGVVMIVCRSLIADENLVWQPEALLSHAASELHYLPVEWKGHAHTDQIRISFENLFQLKAFYLLEELSSAVITPIILLTHIKPICRTLVRFLIENSEGVEGLGNVCTFALMDTGKHGDPTWGVTENNQQPAPERIQNIVPALNGKTELSVLHFATTNPEWEPPKESEKFMSRFKNRMDQEAAALRNAVPGRNLLLESVQSLLVPLPQPISSQGGACIGDALHRVDGPLENSRCLFTSLSRSNPMASSLSNSLRQSGIEMETASSDMRVQALFIRELHSESIRHSTHRQNYNSFAGPSQSVFGVPQMSEFTDSTGERFGGQSVLGRSMIRSAARPTQQSQQGGGGSQHTSPAHQANLPFRGLTRLVEHDETEKENEESLPRVSPANAAYHDERESDLDSDDDDDGRPPLSFSA
ncbi:unnamed protein product, partial [Mesorhabditis belari]|uniref:Autophagy-related protein 9 n=1 Tax=Mesorhabditis belari TaxID=2138241 RepID=A0AAF3JCC7_9BILA